MIKKFFQRIGVLRTPTFVFTKYDVVVYVTSEGTAQGVPRPLKVIKTEFSWELDTGDRYYVSAEALLECEVARIVRYGYTHTLADGMKVKYTPHSIYKITYEISKK